MIKNIWNYITGKNKINIIKLHNRLIKIARKYYGTDFCHVKIEIGNDNKILYSTYISGGNWAWECNTFEESLQEHINNI